MPWTKVPIDNMYHDSPRENDMRKITYRQAIKEALTQAFEIDSRVFIMGEGVDDPGGIFGTTLGLQDKFGAERVFDIPIAENGMTGVAVGSALAGMRPVFVHMRMDFLPLAMDQILNHAVKLRYMSGGKVNVPIVIRSIIGRGWGSAAQHSQSLQAFFVHMPGIKVIMPSTPFDVKGLLMSSIADGNPVIFIEHRWLYENTGYVPEKPYMIPMGKGQIRKAGKDVTIVGVSYMLVEIYKAVEKLKLKNIDVEIIDLRCLKPWDEDIVINSLKKTGRLLIADTGWKVCGFSAEVSAAVASRAFKYLKAPIMRVALPDVHTPASPVLEKAFYPNHEDIILSVEKLMRWK